MHTAADRQDTRADATGRLLAPFARDVLLATGRPVRIRPARVDDVGAWNASTKSSARRRATSDSSASVKSSRKPNCARSVEQDISDHVTLVAEANGELIAIGEYYARPGGEEAEVAFAVADDHHQEGIATVLLEDLAGIARQAGFRRLVASDAARTTSACSGYFEMSGWFIGAGSRTGRSTSNSI